MLSVQCKKHPPCRTEPCARENIGGTAMKGVLKVSVIMPILLICIFLLFSNIASTAADPARDALVRFADRILANQMPDGAIIMGDSAYPPLRLCRISAIWPLTD